MQSVCLTNTRDTLDVLHSTQDHKLKWVIRRYAREGKFQPMQMHVSDIYPVKNTKHLTNDDEEQVRHMSVHGWVHMEIRYKCK